MNIGVLALQGAFVEHEAILKKMGCKTLQVKKLEDLDNVDGLIIPGGESTTIGKLMKDFGLFEKIKEMAENKLPIFGTCAGLILMAKGIEGSDQPRLGIMNVKVKRNAFGRQVDSFETDLTVKGLDGKPVKAVFIRAPYITDMGENVEPLADVDGKIVLAKENNMLVSAFHPELTNDTRIHEIFLNMVKKRQSRD